MSFTANSGVFRRGGGAPFFARNLPSNVSKTQDFRPKIREFFAILGVGVPFSKFLDLPLASVNSFKGQNAVFFMFND
jgi:hypothetical protein